jgi:hypothetical protein
MVAVMKMRMGVGLLFVPMAMYVHEVIGLKQRCIPKNYIWRTGFDYLFSLAKDINNIR